MEARPPLGLLAHLSLTFGYFAVSLCLNLLLPGLCLPGPALGPGQEHSLGSGSGVVTVARTHCLLSGPHSGQGSQEGQTRQREVLHAKRWATAMQTTGRSVCTAFKGFSHRRNKHKGQNH